MMLNLLKRRSLLVYRESKDLFSFYRSHLLFFPPLSFRYGQLIDFHARCLVLIPPSFSQ